MQLSICCNRFVMKVFMDLTAVYPALKQMTVLGTITVTKTLETKSVIQAGIVSKKTYGLLHYQSVKATREEKKWQHPIVALIQAVYEANILLWRLSKWYMKLHRSCPKMHLLYPCDFQLKAGHHFAASVQLHMQLHRHRVQVQPFLHLLLLFFQTPQPGNAQRMCGQLLPC